MAEVAKGTVEFNEGVFTLKADALSANLEGCVLKHKETKQARLWALDVTPYDSAYNVTFDDCGCLKIHDPDLCNKITQWTNSSGSLSIVIRSTVPQKFGLRRTTVRGNTMCPCEFEP